MFPSHTHLDHLSFTTNFFFTLVLVFLVVKNTLDIAIAVFTLVGTFAAKIPLATFEGEHLVFSNHGIG